MFNGEIPEKMSPKIRQWIRSPKIILSLISFDPKSEGSVFLKSKFFTISQKRGKLAKNHIFYILRLLHLPDGHAQKPV